MVNRLIRRWEVAGRPILSYPVEAVENWKFDQNGFRVYNIAAALWTEFCSSFVVESALLPREWSHGGIPAN